MSRKKIATPAHIQDADWVSDLTDLSSEESDTESLAPARPQPVFDASRNAQKHAVGKNTTTAAGKGKGRGKGKSKDVYQPRMGPPKPLMQSFPAKMIFGTLQVLCDTKQGFLTTSCRRARERQH